MLLALLAACDGGYLPETARIWACTSALLCDGVRYEITEGTACVSSSAAPEAVYEDRLIALNPQWVAGCGEWSVEEIVCTVSPLAYCSP